MKLRRPEFTFTGCRCHTQTTCLTRGGCERFCNSPGQPPDGQSKLAEMCCSPPARLLRLHYLLCMLRIEMGFRWCLKFAISGLDAPIAMGALRNPLMILAGTVAGTSGLPKVAQHIVALAPRLRDGVIRQRCPARKSFGGFPMAATLHYLTFPNLTWRRISEAP